MAGAAKTGGVGSPWVELEKPKPPRVHDHYAFWGDPPPELSSRCEYWVRQMERGWAPNRRIRSKDYDSSAEWYGIYIWEYWNIIHPMVRHRRPELLTSGGVSR
jgi:hypothetical protein